MARHGRRARHCRQPRVPTPAKATAAEFTGKTDWSACARHEGFGRRAAVERFVAPENVSRHAHGFPRAIDVR